jgi:N6-adenosine-specific RNA methylase IME4
MADWPFGDLRPLAYDVIVADPPWLVQMRSAAGEKKAPQAHYACMPIGEIAALPVGKLARGDCWLFLWTSAPLLDRAFEVMKAWGFSYCSRTAWRKTTINNKVRVGPGYICRTMHEDVLIGKIGNPCRRKPLPSLFDGLAREHSRKPDEFYAHVEAFAPHSFRLDLFSRQSRPGWDVFGDEAGKFDERDDGGAA